MRPVDPPCQFKELATLPDLAGLLAFAPEIDPVHLAMREPERPLVRMIVRCPGSSRIGQPRVISLPVGPTTGHKIGSWPETCPILGDQLAIELDRGPILAGLDRKLRRLKRSHLVPRRHFGRR